MQGFKYAAFISYAAPDSAFARRLHRRLETYHVPNSLINASEARGRIFPVYRGRDHLMTAGALSDTNEEELRRSYCLIVVCSPSAAQSQWVSDEITYFKSLGRHQHIHPVIAAGPKGNEQITCLPPPLRKVTNRGGVEATGFEILPADARSSAGGFERAFKKLVASILDIPLDILIEAEERRKNARRLSNVALLVGLALLAIGLVATMGIPVATIAVHPSVGTGVALLGLGFTIAGPLLRLTTGRQKRSTAQPRSRVGLGKNGVFIGYRRDDTADVAGRIFDSLVLHFGSGRIFKDVDSIPMGTEFRSYVSSVIERCRVFLVLIGSKWSDCRDSTGNRRLDDPADLVRVEVETALATRHVLVVPVLINNAQMPHARDLPDGMKPLASLNAARVRGDPDYRSDIERLLRQIEGGRR